MRQFGSFVHKEFLHILRDQRTMLILLVMPVILTFLFGYAINVEMKGTRVAVVDHSKDAITLRIIERVAGNSRFTLVQNITKESDLLSAFERNEIDLAIVFAPHFAANLVHQGKADVQLLTDGSEPNQATMRASYAQQLIAATAVELARKANSVVPLQIMPVTRILYNPQGKSEYNFVPAVIAMVLMLICAMMTSVSIVKEKEMGTMEVLLASPLSPLVIVSAKLVPYFVVSCINLGTILLLSVWLLHIPMAGSLLGFVGISMVYILVALLLGLLISTVVKTQLAAMLLSLLLIVPTMYLSGMAFPIESMPPVLQRVSAFFPGRWYVDIARGLMIQGVELRYVMPQALLLLAFALALALLSWRLFKTRLE